MYVVAIVNLFGRTFNFRTEYVHYKLFLHIFKYPPTLSQKKPILFKKTSLED